MSPARQFRHHQPSLVAALGARASPATNPSSAEALPTFTLDSRASRCFFRDYTTLTPLAAPVPVSLADPTWGPVVARASIVLPCPAVPSGSLSGLHLPTFSTNLMSNAAIQDVWVDTFIPGGQRVAICTCSWTGYHLATFTRRPGSSLYTLTTVSAQVAEAGQVAAASQVSTSGQLAASCSCRVLSHQTLLWNHCLGHPSLLCLRGMHSCLLNSGLPRSLPSLMRSPAPPCLPCIKGRQRAVPHSSEFPPTTAPLQTLHMDRKVDVSGVLIPWIRATRHQLRERFRRDFPVLHLHSNKGGEFSSDLAEFCRDEGIHQSFTLPSSPQQNGIAERRIGLIMEVARTSMIHAAAPHFLWPFAVRYAAHQLNLWPRGTLSLVRDAKASKLSSRTLRCVFLGFPTDAPSWQFYQPRSHQVFSSQDVTFDESVCHYRLHPHASHPVDPHPLVEPLEVSSDSSGPAEGGDPAADDTTATRRSPRLETTPCFPLRPSLPPPQPAAVDSGAETAGAELGGAERASEGSGGATTGGPAPSGVSQVDPHPLVEPLEVSSDSSGPAEGGDPAADDTTATRRSPRLETTPCFPLRPSLPPPQPAAVDSGAETAGAELGGAEREGEGSGGAAIGGAATGNAGSGGAGSWGAATGGADSGGPASPSGGGAVGDPAGGIPGGGGYGLAGAGAASPGGTVGAGGTGGTAGDGGTRGAAGAGGVGATIPRGAAGAGGAGATSPRGATGAGGAGPTSPGGTGGTGDAGAAGTGVAGAGCAAGAGGAGGATRATGTGGSGGPGAAKASGAAGAGGAGGAARAASARGAGGAGAGGAGVAGASSRRPFFYPQLQTSLPPPDSVLCQVLSLPSSSGLTPPLLCSQTDQSPPQLLPGSTLPAPAPHTEVTESLTECREPETRASTCVRAPRVACPRPPAVLGIHGMALRPSSVPQRIVLPEPPASSLPHVPDPESDLTRVASPTITRLLATVVTDPDLESTAASALVTELVDFATRSRLGYIANLVSESESVCPLSDGGELALGNLNALEIPTPRSYAGAIACEYSSQRKIAMNAEMASWKSTGPYVVEVPPPGANIVDGMWIFRVKRPPGSPPTFKARCVARGFSLRQRVDIFQIFSPTPKMTTLRVLLHVAAQRDYKLHSLDFSTAFLQGSLHEEIWLRRPPGFTRSFPAGTQWSLRRPVYGLRQAPREWHDTLRTTLAALGFAPSSADPSLFLRTATTLSPFYVLVYVDDLVFAAADIEALALMKTELQERHTCTKRGPSALRLLVLLAIAHSSVYQPLTLSSTIGRVRRTECLGSGPVLWRSTRSSSVLSSTCEGEIYAGAMAAQELRWLTYLLIDLGERPRSPPVLYVDNKAMLALCHEQRLEHITKHIALRYFLACELQQRCQLRLSYMASRANTADVFTKAVVFGDHQRFSTGLGLVPTLPHLLVA
ncbi:unnamed protein product [Closterium sp. NIES-54]